MLKLAVDSCLDSVFSRGDRLQPGLSCKLLETRDCKRQGQSVQVSHLTLQAGCSHHTDPHLTEPDFCQYARGKVELLKESSDFLRHPLMEELVSEEAGINEAAAQLMKFHGSYQQDNREERTAGKGKAYQFMMRTKQPAGAVSNLLYLTMDDLADQVRHDLEALEDRTHPPDMIAGVQQSCRSLQVTPQLSLQYGGL